MLLVELCLPRFTKFTKIYKVYQHCAGEHVYQDISVMLIYGHANMDYCYERQCSPRMLADYCWMPKKDVLDAETTYNGHILCKSHK